MKRIAMIFMCIGIGVSAFSLEFTVAPLYFVDEAAERVDPRNSFQSRILEALQGTATGTELRFRGTGTRYNPPQSVGDAIVVSRGEQATYLLYGFITRKEQTIQGELRLLDYEKREVIASFFAMDSKEREEEFIQELSAKVFRYVKETFNIVVVSDPESFTHIQFPLSLGYWQPVDKNWIDLMFGFFRIDAGIQCIPSDIVFVANGYDHYVSLGLDVSYRLGMGHYYEAWDHGFTITLPILVHRKFNAQHEAYAGIGLLYTFDLLRIKKPYEEPATEKYSAGGLMASGGWTFRLHENVLLFVDLRAELRMYDSPMITVSPRVGVILRGLTQEVVRTW
jgi:hypothetical protein